MNEEEFDKLKEDSYQVSQLLDHPGWQVVIEEVENRIATRERFINYGKARSYEEYREAVGLIDGYHSALIVPREIIRRYESEVLRRDQLS